MGSPSKILRHEGAVENTGRIEAEQVQAIVDEVTAGQPHRCEAEIYTAKEKHGYDVGPWNARVRSDAARKK